MFCICVKSCVPIRIFGDPCLRLLALSLGAGLFASDLSADASKVTIGLQGHISPKCGLSDMSGQLDFGKAGMGRESRRATVDFTIDCNTPFIYRLSAQEGAMRLQGSGPAANPARARLPYDVSLTIPTDDGGTLRASCDGHILGEKPAAHGCDADSSCAVAMNKRGQLMITLQPVGEVPAAGKYSDDIQITMDIKR